MNRPDHELRGIFQGLILKYRGSILIAEQLWEEIALLYSEKGRFYHTLHHLKHLYQELSEVNHLITDRDAVLFALFYHDSIYRIDAGDNEEKSAGLADERMHLLSFPEERRERTLMHILATKEHRKSPDEDTDFFTDADLSMLGQDPERYSEYAANIRKEYSIYPDAVYRTRRKKVLEDFLKMKRIFKTKVFYDKYEADARKNISDELSGIRS